MTASSPAAAFAEAADLVTAANLCGATFGDHLKNGCICIHDRDECSGAHYGVVIAYEDGTPVDFEGEIDFALRNGPLSPATKAKISKALMLS